VTVFHTLRAYMANPLELNPVDIVLKDKVYAFAGEVHADEGMMTLPSIFVQPENLEAILTNHDVLVPTEGALATAWGTYDQAAAPGIPDMGELMPARLVSETMSLPQVMVIPTLFIPLLIDGHTPREAWKIIHEAVNKWPVEQRPVFDRLLAYLRAASVKNASRGPNGELSLMTTTWAAPAANTRPFRAWQVQILKMLYSAAFEGAAGGGNTGGSAFPPTFFEGLAGALKIGVNQAAAKYEEVAAASALASEKETPTASKWSPLVQELIIRCHGLPTTATWESPEISPIWADYEDAFRGTGSTEAEFQRVFMANMPGSASIERGFEKAPVLMRSNAKDIKAGRLGPIARAITYENCDQGLLPLAFMERSNEELVEAGFDDEEYDGTTHRTIETERSRSSRSRQKNAPATFSGSTDLLKTYARVLENHFSTSCPLYGGICLVWEALVAHESTWQAHMTSVAGARLWWGLTKIAWQFLTSQGWNADGSAPSVDVSHIVLNIRGGSMSPIVDMPPRLMAGAAVLPPPPPGGMMGGGIPPLPGQVPTERTNPSVDSRVMAMLGPAVTKLGGVVKFSTLLGYAAAAGQSIRYPEVVLSSSDCQEYMTVGRCADPRCSRRHQQGAAPEVGKVENFITKMQPIVSYILNTPAEQLRRRVRARR
jgi:hypothetical protein